MQCYMLRRPTLMQISELNVVHIFYTNTHETHAYDNIILIIVLLFIDIKT